MLIMLILNVIVLFIGAIFSWLPQIETLPTILGYDIDTGLLTAVGQFKLVATSFWLYSYILGGALIILGYYAIKFVLKFFLGSRAP